MQCLLSSIFLFSCLAESKITILTIYGNLISVCTLVNVSGELCWSCLIHRREEGHIANVHNFWFFDLILILRGFFFSVCTWMLNPLF